MPDPSKKPAGARRFRRGDEEVRAVSSFADLDQYTCFLDYLLGRIDAQCKEIRSKLGHLLMRCKDAICQHRLAVCPCACAPVVAHAHGR